MSFRKILFFSFFLVCISYPQQEDMSQLRSIKFEGNDHFSSSSLHSIIYSQESPGWFWQFLNSFTPFGAGPVYFDSTDISLDVSALKDFYNANGFFDMSVSYKYSVDTANAAVDLTYMINEGKPSTYGKKLVFGIDSVHRPLYYDLYGILYLDTTKRFEQSVVQQKSVNAVTTLTNEGYLFADFDSVTVLRDTVRDKANLDMYFTPGKRYKIDTVIVQTNGEGANEVDENMLRDITGIKKGDYYGLEKVKRSQARLFRTGLFNSVFISAVGNDTTDSKVPLKMVGTIGQMNELSPEIIMNNEQSAFNIGLGATYIRKNFLGNARKFTLSSSFGVQDFFNTDFGKLFKKFSFRDTTLLGYFDTRLKIEQPFLFGKPIYGTWENYVTINKQTNYNNTLYGSKLTFDFELPTYTFINYLSAYYNVESSHEIYRTYNDSLSIKFLSLIGADFGSTTVDNILFPTRGYNLSFLVEEANSLPYMITKVLKDKYNGTLFYKLQVNYSTYFTLNPKRTSIFATKIKVGHLQSYLGSYAGIPLNRTFYAGGSNSIRGWRANQLIPPGTDTVLFVNGINVKGGTFLLEGSFEYRYKFLGNYGVALFTDYGNTFLGFHQFRYDKLAVAVGFGFRYYTSVAPFRIDFGFKLYDPSNKEFIFQRRAFSTMEVHFGIGEAF